MCRNCTVSTLWSQTHIYKRDPQISFLTELMRSFFFLQQHLLKKDSKTSKGKMEGFYFEEEKKTRKSASGETFLFFYSVCTLREKINASFVSSISSVRIYECREKKICQCPVKRRKMQSPLGFNVEKGFKRIPTQEKWLRK